MQKYKDHCDRHFGSTKHESYYLLLPMMARVSTTKLSTYTGSTTKKKPMGQTLERDCRSVVDDIEQSLRGTPSGVFHASNLIHLLYIYIYI